MVERGPDLRTRAMIRTLNEGFAASVSCLRKASYDRCPNDGDGLHRVRLLRARARQLFPSNADPLFVFRLLPSCQVVAGRDNSCGLRPNGQVDCWGSNFDGQSTPPRDVQFRQLSASNSRCVREQS